MPPFSHFRALLDAAPVAGVIERMVMSPVAAGKRAEPVAASYRLATDRWAGHPSRRTLP